MLVLVCEDNRKDLAQTTAALQALNEKNGFPASVRAFATADEMLFSWDDFCREVGVVFLDIGLPGTDGIAAAKALRHLGFEGEIVFLTGHKDEWETAFEVDAVWFAVKDGLTAGKLERIYRKAMAKAVLRQARYITFSCAGQSVAVNIEDITYFEVNARLMTVHYRDKTFQFYTTMDKLEQTLTGNGFLRVHRSFLVAHSAIRKLEGADVLLQNGTRIPLGRNYSGKVRSTLRGK